jgi:type I restriction enzyme S subunit
MGESGFDYSERRYIPISAAVADELAIKDGDFFVARGNGSLHLVGRGTLAQPPAEQIVFPDTMIRLRISTPISIRKYVGTIWSSRVVRRQIEKKARTTAGIYKISQRDIDAFTIPLPPLAEQEQIMAEVERRLSLAQESESQLDANLKRSSRLRQSILKRAFEGKLVPQDPKDEPAIVLLERIKANKADTNEKAKPRKTR